MDSSNEELTKMVIAEKDKINLKYKQKLNSIKQHYGVEFDVDHFSNNGVKNITFINLKYKNLFTNVSVTYNSSSGKFDYIDYEFSETRTVKNLNHKRLIPNLNKEYKLKLIVAEIERLNSEYVRELNEVDTALKNTPKNDIEYEKTLLVNKDDKND